MSKKQLYDNHGRQIRYLRLAVTDRCNLRCFYCMPEEGIQYVEKRELLSYEEMLRTIRLLAGMGIEKVRLTGGEPFVRKDIVQFIRRIKNIEGIQQVNITTNGTLTAPFIPDLKKLGIQSVNLSLDTLDKDRFFQITRRSVFDEVMKTLDLLLEHSFQVKINTVVMKGKNIEDIIPMVELTRSLPIHVRFIEEMPFNGSGNGNKENTLEWNYKKILSVIKQQYPGLQKIPDVPYSTSANYSIPGHKGNVGVIAAYSRTFCGTCNRIRITSKGTLKTCLYDDGIFNIKKFIREGATDQQLESMFLNALAHRAKDGFEAEEQRWAGMPVSESMASIGG